MNEMIRAAVKEEIQLALAEGAYSGEVMRELIKIEVHKGGSWYQGIQGIQGQVGEQGIPGQGGRQGPPGMRGERGATGQPGKDGKDFVKPTKKRKAE